MKQNQTKLNLPVFYSLFLIFLCASLRGAYDTQVEIDSLNLVYEKASDWLHKQRILKALSNCYQNKGDWEHYEKVVQQMLLLQEEKTDSFYLAETYNKLGISNCCLGRNQKALDYFNKALEINLAQNMELIAANSYENLGVVYKDVGNYTKAVECQLKSLELRKEKNSERIFNNYIKLSIVLELLGDMDKMDYYVSLAKREMNKRDSINPRNKALFYNQLGEIYERRGLNDSSIVCYRNVISNSALIGWNLGIAEGLRNIAGIFYKEEQLDSAIFYHKKSLKLSQDISNSQSISEGYLYLAKLYDEIEKYDSVMLYANNALKIAEEADLLLEQSNALKFMANFYSSQNNFKKANWYLQQHYMVRDSIASSDVKNNVAELETKYETKVKQQHIELLTADNEIKNQRMWLFIAATTVLILVLIIGVFILFELKKKIFNVRKT